MTDYNEFNRGVIAEFREKQGRVASFGEASMILITHKGAKSDKEYVTPLVCSREGDSYVIIASMGGAPTDPQWFRNLVANPAVTVEFGTEKFEARARVTEGDERARLFRAQADLMPNFDEYQAKTTRQIPVVVLERV